MQKSYRKPSITKNTILGILQHPTFFRSHVRTMIGNIYNDGEFEKRSNNVLSMRLP